MTVVRHRLFWPAVVLVALLVVNVGFSHSFFKVELRDGHLYGSLVDILRASAPLILVALGMTLVIATGGIDVGTKAQIQRLVADLSDGGMAVLFISAELEEVLRLSHKVAVLRDRVVVAELANTGDVDADLIMTTIATGAPQ